MRPNRSASRLLLFFAFALVALSPGLARSAAPPNPAALSAQLRRAANDPYLTAEQRAFYNNRLIAVEGGRADSVPPVTPPGGDATWSVYAQSPRRSSAMVVHDVANDRLIMFGGISAQGLQSDVWTVSLSGDRVWRRLAVGPGPSARLGAAVSFDPDQHRLLVYGGADVDGSYLDDLWSLSLEGPPVWSPLSPTGQVPGARANASGVQDTLHHRMVVIGGSDGSFSPPVSVWTLPFVANPQWAALPITGTPPSGPGPAFYDPARNSALVFTQSPAYPYAVAIQELGLDTPYAWTNVPLGCCGPGGGSPTPAAFDPLARTLVTWSSGIPSSCYRVRLNPTSPTWEYLYSGQMGPYAHNATALLFDWRSSRTLMVAGQTGSSSYEADVWSSGSDPMQWAPEVIPLTRRNGAAMAIDAARHQVYLAAGICDTSANNTVDRLTNALWRMTLGGDAAWQRLPSRGGPMLGRSQATLVHDTSRDRLVLFGGQRTGTMTNEVWTYSLTDSSGWQRLVIPGMLPRQRASHGAVYDSIGDRMVVFGGVDANTTLGDVWALGFAPTPHWQRLQPTGLAPDARSGVGMVFDPDSLRILIGGGAPNYYSYYGFADELWSLDLLPLRWRRLIGYNPYTNGYRSMALLAYDRAHHEAILAQGYDYYNAPRETRVRIARPGRDSVWTPVLASGTAPPIFFHPMGLLDPDSGLLFVQGDGEGDIYSSSDERMFALALQTAILDVPRVGAADGMSLEAYPNPSRGTFHLRWAMAKPGPVEIEVFDVAGRRVAALHVPATSGARDMTIGASNDALPVGLYLVRARLAGAQLTRRVAVLH